MEKFNILVSTYDIIFGQKFEIKEIFIQTKKTSLHQREKYKIEESKNKEIKYHRMQKK